MLFTTHARRRQLEAWRQRALAAWQQIGRRSLDACAAELAGRGTPQLRQRWQELAERVRRYLARVAAALAALKGA